MEHGKTWLALGVVLIVSFFTYVYRYDYPPYFFWDENYHVSHAQKYLNGVFFMEPHPPLGKLLIALGEWLLKANAENNQFIGTDHAKMLPSGFSFAGYRLVPVIMGWLTAPVLFLVLLLLTSNTIWALLLSFMYIFDNALIVHTRGAMLEGPQLFFIACVILAFLLLCRYQNKSRAFFACSAMFGLAFAAVMTIKLNGLVLILLLPALFLKLWPNPRKFLEFLWPAGVAFTLFYISVWQIHFSLGKKIEPSLPNRGYYQASEVYKRILAEGTNGSLWNFPLMLKEHLKFVSHYERGVPKLNLCKQEENGSPFYLWPVGGRSINYRWEKSGTETRYLYLQSNPAVWLICLAAVFAAAGLCFSGLVLPLSRPLKQPLYLCTFLGLYAGYMAAMALLARVMYLYHYFIPLLCAVLLLGLVLVEIQRVGPFKAQEGAKTIFLVIIAALILLAYNYYAPFTYYRPISDQGVKKRAWLGIWDLRCVTCPLTNGLASPVCDPKVKPSPDLYLSGLRAGSGYQDWGDPKSNRTVEDQEMKIMGVKYTSGFGVHANSTLTFRLRKEYSEFTALVGLPDYLKQKSTLGSVVFEVLGDGRLLWSSGIMHAEMPPQEVKASVKDVDTLILSVRDAGDGIDNDHALWLNPRLLGGPSMEAPDTIQKKKK